MNGLKKGLHTKLAFIFGGIYLILFAVYFLGYYTEVSDLFVYLDLIFSRISYFLIPMIAGVVTLVTYSAQNLKSALIRLLPLSLVRLIYFVAYFYLFLTEGGVGGAGVVILSVVLAIADALFAYVLSLIVFIIIKNVVLKMGGDLRCAIETRTAVDFKDPISLSAALISILPAAVFLAGEIGDTVSFIMNYGFSFTVGEIIYTVLFYIFDFSLFFIHYILVILTKNLIVKGYVR